MRVIAGEFKGRRIDAVPGDSTRPSSDMLREAFASTIISGREDGFEGASFFDAFAGSGAVGIEALSRGVATCLFMDIDQKAISTVESNLEPLPLQPGQAVTRCGDTFETAQMDAGSFPGCPFDIVYIDPPYAVEASSVCSLMADLAAGGALADGAVVAYELLGSGKPKKVKGQKKDKNAVPPLVVSMLERLGGGFGFVGTRFYGKSQVIYFEYGRLEGEPANSAG